MKMGYFKTYYAPLISKIIDSNKKAIVVLGDEIVAWACYNDTHLHYLHVRKEHRSNHIAKLILSKIKDLNDLKITFVTNDFIKKFKKFSFEPYHRG